MLKTKLRITPETLLILSSVELAAKLRITPETLLILSSVELAAAQSGSPHLSEGGIECSAAGTLCACTNVERCAPSRRCSPGGGVVE